jgi:glycosyltransferase involved in cell wall biosynthesis
MKLPECTLIISTYNRNDALSICLESVLAQTYLPNRIIIADDGSGEDTRLLIENFSAKVGKNRCSHVWQPNQGFRVARIRNKALHNAHPDDYIIQIDGDMILHSCFIADHLYFAEKGWYVRGNKYLLDEQETQHILEKGLLALHTINFPLNRSSKARRVVLLRNLFRLLRVDIKGVFGSNMAFWHSDATAINGYDNSFYGWGSEDDDFADRLRLYGIRCKGIKFGAIAYHLHHPPAERTAVERNNQLRTSHVLDKQIRAVNGYAEAQDDTEK